jgi:DNA-binding response OmpR family regulator
MARVLLVTADRDLAFLVDLSLLRAGHAVEEMLAPGALPRRLAGRPPHAVVLDCAPTDGAGERLVADLRRHWPRCPVLLVAARAAGAEDAQALGRLLEVAQPAALLRRPVEPYELVWTLDRVVRSASARAA